MSLDFLRYAPFLNRAFARRCGLAFAVLSLTPAYQLLPIYQR